MYKIEYEIALSKARKAGATDVYYIDDCWGGYWQCKTAHGPYNFRCNENRPISEPASPPYRRSARRGTKRYSFQEPQIYPWPIE